MKKILSFAVLPFLLAACADDGATNNGYGAYNSEDVIEESLNTAVSDVSPAYLLGAAPKYYVGSPYKVEDTQYVPAEDMTYNQTGLAGIIPVDLNGTQTTNGETFDSNQLVATSKTLPLPSIVRVTNLNNGTSAILRVNNRGPFVNSRIMDVSPAAARALGMNGNTKVQVQVLEEQSKAVKALTLGTTTAAVAAPVVETPTVSAGTGEYSVQTGAFYSEDSAQSMKQRMAKYGNATVVSESGMYKVRITGLDASSARSTIDTLRSNESVVPGLLKDGKWVNPDSI